MRLLPPWGGTAGRIRCRSSHSTWKARPGQGAGFPLSEAFWPCPVFSWLTRRSGASGRFGQHLLWLQVDRKLVKVGHTDAHQLSDHIAEGGIGLRGSHLDELGHLRLESGHHASARAKGRPAAVSLPDCHSAIIAISCRNSAETRRTLGKFQNWARCLAQMAPLPRGSGVARAARLRVTWYLNDWAVQRSEAIMVMAALI